MLISSAKGDLWAESFVNCILVYYINKAKERWPL